MRVCVAVGRTFPFSAAASGAVPAHSCVSGPYGGSYSTNLV